MTARSAVSKSLVAAAVASTLALLCTVSSASEERQDQPWEPRIPNELVGSQYQILYILPSQRPELPEGLHWGNDVILDLMHMGRDMKYEELGKEALCVRVSLSESEHLAVDGKSIRLTDSEGYSFALTPGGQLRRHGGLFLRYEVDRKSACDRIRYSDPDYYLKLEVPIQYAGKPFNIVIPRINPVVERVVDHGYDSLPGALFPVVLLVGTLVVALVVYRLRRGDSRRGSAGGPE